MNLVRVLLWRCLYLFYATDSYFFDYLFATFSRKIPSVEKEVFVQSAHASTTGIDHLFRKTQNININRRFSEPKTLYPVVLQIVGCIENDCVESFTKSWLKVIRSENCVPFRNVSKEIYRRFWLNLVTKCRLISSLELTDNFTMLIINIISYKLLISRHKCYYFLVPM